MANQENFDVLLRLMLDEESKKRIASGISTIDDELEKLENTAKKTSSATEKIDDGLTEAAKASKRLGDETKRATAEVDKNARATIAAMKQEASAMRKIAALRAKEIGELKERAAWIERGAKPLLTAGIAGFTALSLIAKKYIDNTAESNEITKAWAENSAKIEQSQMRIGKVAAEALLPMFTKLADITEKVADYVEKNPEVVSAGLNVAKWSIAIGAIGVLISKGIKLYADVAMIAVGDTQLLAAKMMADAAKMQLASATTGKVAGVGAAVPAAGTAVSGAGTAAAGTAAAGLAASPAIVLLVGAIALAVGTYLGNTIGNIIGKFIYGEEFKSNLGNVIQTVFRLFSLPTQMIMGLLNKLGIVSDSTAQAYGGLISKIDSSIGTLTGAEGAVERKSEANVMEAQTSIGAASANQIQSATNKNVERSSEAAQNSIGKMPNAFQKIGSSISDFFSRIFSSARSGAPKHDYTGYAYSRTYAMAQDGQRQFVMSGSMTKQMEALVGGSLTERNVASRMSNQVIWNDNRKFSGEYSAALRNNVKLDTLKLLNGVLK